MVSVLLGQKGGKPERLQELSCLVWVLHSFSVWPLLSVQFFQVPVGRLPAWERRRE